MRVLFNETHTKTDTYHFEINGGGEFYIKESGEVTIIFENDKFVSASFPLSGVYSRNGWRILAGINEMINKIEEEQKNGEVESDCRVNKESEARPGLSDAIRPGRQVYGGDGGVSSCTKAENHPRYG